MYTLSAAILILALVQTACSLTIPSTSTPTSASGGVVKGVVYEDVNGNGIIEAGEGPLDGVQVSIADCGPAQNQLTGADGAFNFSNLPAGTCHVTVTKSGYHFSGSFPSLTYPFPAASDPSLPTAFSLYMAPDGAGPTDTPEAATEAPAAPTDTATPSPTATDTATPSVAMVTPTSENTNCRYGPGTDWLSVGGLQVGQNVPILGKLSDQSWWQIDNPQAPGMKCWVSAAVTTTSGDVSTVPVVSIPIALVTNVLITTPSVVHGYCGGPNPTSFSLTITTNGPVTVVYHLEIYNEDGSLRNKTDNTSLDFSKADTKTFDPGGAYSTDCGNYKIKAVVTSPNNMTSEASWSVVSP